METRETKKARRERKLNQQYERYKRLATFLGVKNPNGKKISTKLWGMEKRAHKMAEDYCNGVISSKAWKAFSDGYKKEIEEIFKVPVPGLKINGDTRGHALKINDEYIKTYYPPEIEFYKDWDGYGILSPEIY